MKTSLQTMATSMVAILAAFGLSFGFMSLAPIAHAQPLSTDEFFGGDVNYTGDDFAEEAGLGSQSLPTTIASIIRVILGFLGVVAVIFIILGGFKWMMAGGETTKVEKARNFIVAGIIGLAIVLAAYAIASFVINSLATAIGNS